MKFTEGMWRMREGMHIDWMGHVEQARHNDHKLDMLLTSTVISISDKKSSATITTRITSPTKDIIGVKFVHWNLEEHGPYFHLHHHNPKLSISGKKGENIDFSSGSLKLSVNTAPNELGFKYTGVNGVKVTSHSFRSIGYVRDQTTNKSQHQDGLFMESEGYMLAALDLGVGEKIYGLGERFGPFIKNGQSIVISNEDGGTSSELAYKNIPFYLSSKGYGVFVNDSGKVNFEVQSERTTRVNISTLGESLEYFVIYGPTPKEVLNKYTALTGRPVVPPSWSYNLWLTTSFTTSYDEKTVTSFLDGFKMRDIPLGVFHFDCFWMKAFQWCDFKFNEDVFPDAAGYLKRLKEQGLKICVWINSYIGQASPLFEEGKKAGYFIKRTDGQVFQCDNWQAGMALVDFTNPGACEWYGSYLRKLVDMGVDSFKTDFGERVPFMNVVYHDGSDPVKMHNYYSLLYNRCVNNVLTDALGKSKGCLFARSATVGCQQFPVHWCGDPESTFEAMAECLRGGLSFGLGGFGFWAHDIGGFEGTPSAALYKRWTQFGLLSSHSRLHGSASYRVPWIYGEDCSKVLRDFVKLKISLTPYLLQHALKAHRNGTPLMRAIFLEFPEDLDAYNIDTQFLLGPDLLVAPVFNEEGTVAFYVPLSETGESLSAKWVSWFDHEKVYEGGKWYTEKHGFDTLPLLVRPGAVVPINRQLRAAQDVNEEGLELLVNGPVLGTVTVELVDPDQTDAARRTLQVEPDGEMVTVSGHVQPKITYLH
ncbi:hypothetical protein MMC34_004945 [Xylographa carneopallida]|nr:hypothetical protein [Xylographa carneopallida]